MTTDVFGNRLSRTVEVAVDPGHEPVDRYSFGMRLESTVGLRTLEAVGPTANRNYVPIDLHFGRSCKWIP
jgi:hypothetical protein